MSGTPAQPARTPSGSASGPGGSIFDLGYQAYDGPRLGPRSAVLALFAQTVASAQVLVDPDFHAHCLFLPSRKEEWYPVKPPVWATP